MKEGYNSRRLKQGMQLFDRLGRKMSAYTHHVHVLETSISPPEPRLHPIAIVKGWGAGGRRVYGPA
jgi:hypothetical protein